MLMSSSSLNVGHMESVTRPRGQMKGKPCEHSIGHIFYQIFIKLDANVCLDADKIKFEWVMWVEKLGHCFDWIFITHNENACLMAFGSNLNMDHVQVACVTFLN